MVRYLSCFALGTESVGTSFWDCHAHRPRLSLVAAIQRFPDWLWVVGRSVKGDIPYSGKFFKGENFCII